MEEVKKSMTFDAVSFLIKDLTYRKFFIAKTLQVPFKWSLPQCESDKLLAIYTFL